MWICDRRLYRSADGRKIVEETDVRARTLIAAKGDELKEKPVVEKLNTGQKAMPQGEDKALKPSEDKGGTPSEDKGGTPSEDKGTGKACLAPTQSDGSAKRSKKLNLFHIDDYEED